jgi:hypothetical protein
VLSAAIGVAGLLAGCADDTSTAPATAGTAAGPNSIDTEATSGGTVDSSVNTTTDESASPPASTANEGSTPVTCIDPGLKPFIDIAVADLAKRLSTDAAKVSVVSASLTSWPDSSLGCPQPGQQYAQVATDGSLMILKVGDTLYRYHAGGSRKPFLCEGA